MSDTTPVPTPDPVKQVEPEADVNAAVKNASDEAVAHTPKPEVPEPPAPPAEPSKADDGLGELREVVTGLSTTVATLVDTVAKMASGDDTPVKVPWTHRGGDRR